MKTVRVFFIMTITMIVDGVEHNVNLSEEQVQQLLDTAGRQPYARVGYGETYYYLDNLGDVKTTDDIESNADDRLYDFGNYWANKKTCEDDARADILLRQLRRFAMENGGYFDKDTDDLMLSWCLEPADKPSLKEVRIYKRYTSRVGMVGFASWDAARDALTQFRDEIIWYLYTYLPSKEMK